MGRPSRSVRQKFATEAIEPTRRAAFEPLEQRLLLAADGVVNYHAVLVGISDYPGEDLDLDYCDDDAYAFRDVLMDASVWERDSGNIDVLIDGTATKSGIQHAIQSMGAAADEDDLCLFFFAGHGYESAAAPGTEYLCPYDSWLWDDSYDISDMELGGWLNALPTDKYIAMFASCNSGGMDANNGGVVLSACAANETCLEDPIFGHEIFTYFVLDAMGNGLGDTDGNQWLSAEECYTYAAPKTVAWAWDEWWGHDQHPRLVDEYGGDLDFFPLYDPAPTDIALSADTVAEDVSVGATVGVLSSTDPDAGESFTYSVVSDDAPFSVSGNELKTSDRLDYETQDSYSIQIQTVDSTGLSYTETFTITVTDVNEPPTDIALSGASVPEAAPNGTVVGTLSGTDAQGGPVTLSLIDDAGGRFAINGTDLIVADGSLLDHESSASHNVTVQATDGGGLTGERTFVIAVTNVNEAPTGIGLSSAFVWEISLNGTVVGALSTADPDIGDSFAYTLLDHAEGRFAISGQDLVVADGSRLDYESQTSHVLTVRVTDSGGATVDQTFTVHVLDVNENPAWMSDFNGDGQDDLLWRHRGGENQIWFMNGGAMRSIADLPTVGPETGWNAVGVGDFNGDGHADILWRHADGRNEIWLMQGGALVAPVGLAPVSSGDWSVAGAGDFNGDRKADILWRHSDGTNHVWFVDAVVQGGEARIVGTGNLAPVTDPSWFVAGVGDFNGDRNADVLWRHADGTNLIWFLAGTRRAAEANAPAVADLSWYVSSIGDYNGDGKTDIFWRHEGGANQIWFMDGATRLVVADVMEVAPAWRLPGGGASAAATGPTAVQGDFDGDGYGDILWRNANGENQLWFMDGETVRAETSLPAVTDPNWRIVGVADFDGDGKCDILWRHGVFGQVHIWFMNIATIRSEADAPLVSDVANWRIDGVGDFDGDGKADILWRHSSGRNHIWFMDGAAISSAADTPAVGDPAWQVAGVGDFDGDGRADILWRHESGDSRLWSMDGAGVVSQALVTCVGDADWKIGGVSDCDGDGKADILWRYATGRNVVWFMNGAEIDHTTDLRAVGDLDWQIA